MNVPLMVVSGIKDVPILLFNAIPDQLVHRIPANLLLVVHLQLFIATTMISVPLTLVMMNMDVNMNL